MTEFVYRNTPVKYEDTGAGEHTVLLLHGWGGSSASMAPLIRDLKGDHRVIAPDLPGHGESGIPEEPWDVDDYTDCVIALADRAGVGRADLIAHSFGGRIALKLGAEHPERIGRMLLTGCAGIPTRPEAERRLRAGMAGLVKKVGNTVLGSKADTLRERFIARHGSQDYKALPPSMRETFNRVLDQDLTPCLSKIKAPTLLAWGTLDTATPFWMGEQMERTIRDAALIRFEGGTHFAYLEQYPRFLAIAREFLK